jgi:peptidoglycan/LPS O-acetylase OafA/YrhL
LGWLNHFWSLAVEEHFYLAWPLVIFSLSRRQAMWTCGALFVGSALSRVGWALWQRESVAPEVFTLFRLDGLVSGAFLALAARGSGGLLAWVPTTRWILLVTSLGLIPYVARGSRMLTLPDSLWALWSAAVLVEVVTASSSGWLGSAARWPWLTWLGKYSYGMYMFQNPLIPLLAGVVTAPGLARQLGSPLAGQLAYCGIMSLATAGVAYLSWHAFEKHWLKLKHRFETPRTVSVPEAPTLSGQPLPTAAAGR